MLPKLPSWAMGAREISITLIMVHSGVTPKNSGVVGSIPLKASDHEVACRPGFFPTSVSSRTNLKIASVRLRPFLLDPHWHSRLVDQHNASREDAIAARATIVTMPHSPSFAPFCKIPHGLEKRVSLLNPSSQSFPTDIVTGINTSFIHQQPPHRSGSFWRLLRALYP